VKGRLERGRLRLHDRLIRRGLTLSALLSAAELSREPASAATVAQWALPTVRAAMRFAVGRTAVDAGSAKATALAQEIVQGSLSPLKIPVALLLTAGLLAVGLLAHR